MNPIGDIIIVQRVFLGGFAVGELGHFVLCVLLLLLLLVVVVNRVLVQRARGACVWRKKTLTGRTDN